MKRHPLRRAAATFQPSVEIVEDRTAPSANPLFGAASSLLALPNPSSLLKTAIQPVQTTSQTLTQAPAVPSIINSVVSTVPTTLSGLLPTTPSAPAPNLLSAVTNVVSGVVATAEQTVNSTVGSLLSTATNTVTPGLLPAVTNVVSDLLTPVDQVVTGTVGGLLSTVTNVVPILAPVTNSVDSLVTTVVDLPTNVVNDVAGTGSAPAGNTGGLGGLLGAITAPVVTAVDSLVSSPANNGGTSGNPGGVTGVVGQILTPGNGSNVGMTITTVEMQLPIVTTDTNTNTSTANFTPTAQGGASATTETPFVVAEEASPVLLPTKLVADPAPAIVSLVGAAFARDLDAPSPTGTDAASTDRAAPTVTGTGDDAGPVSISVPLSQADVTADTEAAGFVSGFAPIDPDVLAQALGQFAGQLDALRGGVSDWLGDHSALMPWLAVMASSAVGLELYRRRARLQPAALPGV